MWAWGGSLRQDAWVSTKSGAPDAPDAPDATMERRGGPSAAPAAGATCCTAAIKLVAVPMVMPAGRSSSTRARAPVQVQRRLAGLQGLVERLPGALLLLLHGLARLALLVGLGQVPLGFLVAGVAGRAAGA